MNLTPQEISLDILLEKYAKDDESTPDDVFKRVAKALASVEKDPDKWEQKFLQALQDGFIPAGRIMSAAGTDIEATLINCFVVGVADSIQDEIDGYPGIYPALQQAAETMRRGGGVGYDFSRIRPKGAWVNKTKSYASGPLSYMRVFDKSCETVESAGSRRGAQLAALRCDHPDIEEFIHAKDTKTLSNFNMSVGVTDAFMKAVEKDLSLDLVHEALPGDIKQKSEGFLTREGYPVVMRSEYRRTKKGEWVYKTIRARDLWKQIMESTYDHGEPGILFLDRINNDNNLHYAEVLETTNPCGEIPIPPYGCCCLSSINLTRMVVNPFTDDAHFDFDKFMSLISIAVRMLDNVLDLTYWPLKQQREEAMAKRRIGLGFTGLGDALIMMGLRYDSAEARVAAGNITEFLRDHAYAESISLAKEKGPFPLLGDRSQYLEGRFIKRLPDAIRAGIKECGIRNSHLLSIAPTGTISLAFADNASNGIEPAFTWGYTRKKRMPDGSEKFYSVEDHAYRLYRSLYPDTPLPGYFVDALSISANDHMDMQAAVQQFVDQSISKTVNIPEDYPFEDFQALYMDAWKAGLKGLATYRPNAIHGSVLSVDKPKPVEEVKNTLRRWEHRPKFPQGSPARSFATKATGNYFEVCVALDDNGQPFEVWVAGEGAEAATGALAMTLSLLMQLKDTTLAKGMLNKLKDYHVRDSEFWEGSILVPGKQKRYLSQVSYLAEAILYVYQQTDKGVVTTHSTLTGKTCKECGEKTVIRRDGCDFCTACGAVGACS